MKRLFRNSEYKVVHLITQGPPNDWAGERGATHSLHINADGSTRPCKIAKSRIYVGVDEEPENCIKWETWPGQWLSMETGRVLRSWEIDLNDVVEN